VCLWYRVVLLGQPKGPWRPTRKQAEADAASADLGERDEWGSFYLDAFADIEARHENDLIRSGVGHPASSTKTLGLRS